VASSTSLTSQRNRTFLNIDSILYPKEPKKEVVTNKGRRKGGRQDNLNLNQDPSQNYMEIKGLKGYGKSG